MDEYGGGEACGRRLRRGLPNDQRSLVRETPASAERFSPPSPGFNPLGAASSLRQPQTLDGGSFSGFYSAGEADRAYLPGWSLDSAFDRMCSLQPSAGEFPSALFFPYYGLDGSQYRPMPTADQSCNLDGGFLINSRRGGESLSQNMSSTPSFSNSSRSSPDSRGAGIGSVWSLSGYIVDMAMSQDGSRNLQILINALTSDHEVEFLLDELLTRVGDVMVNAYGNYVFQKLIERLSHSQRSLVVYVLHIQNQLLRVCQDASGVRVMQRLLESVDPNPSYFFDLVTKCLLRYVVKLANHTNGQHIILHCLRYFPESCRREILITIAPNCVEVAQGKTGCCMMQKCVELARDSVKELLLIEILCNAVDLSADRYGNYVVQHILGLMMPNVTMCLLQMLKGHFMELSMSKFGSNVVEKCLKECSEQQAQNIIMELIESPGLSSLFVDQFGNYVIQSALEVSRGETRKSLIEAIVCNSSSMRCNLYGKKILGWLEKRRFIYSR